MKQIHYDISDNLYIKMSEIKKYLEEKEGHKITFNDLIEEALLGYFNINLIDFNDEYEYENAEVITDDHYLNYGYYVYAYIDLTKNEKIDIGIDKFNYEPFYIGMGCSERVTDFNERSDVVSNKIEELREIDGFGYKILKEGLKKSEASKYETQYISLLGRVDKSNGCLLNKNAGNCNVVASKDKSLDLDRQLAIHILDVLNKYKTKNKASKILNISERTLYRKLHQYGIVRDDKSTIKKYCFSKLP